MTTSKPCRYVPGYGHYLRTHELTCHDNTCDGCQPCTHDQGSPVRHCTARTSCGQHLPDDHAQTCPRCIGRTRDDINAILDAVNQLPAEALEEGVNSEAANLAGPAADPFTWTRNRVRQLRAGTPATSIDPEDPHHPKAVLGRWELMIREHYNQLLPDDFTIHNAARYLLGVIGLVAQDPEQDWAQLAAELRACRSHLEDVLHTARRPETGAPCPGCEAAPPLHKVYAHWCEQVDCTREHDRTGAKDTWRCPACRSTWTEAEYRLWVADDYLDNAQALTAAEIHQTHGIKPATLRKRAERDPRLKRGKNHHGQMTYDVERALASDTPNQTSDRSA